MSLQVWLPLTGHLNNQGLSNVTVTNNGATVDNSGKLGKCYSFNGSSNSIHLANLTKPADITVAFWMKRNSTTNTRQFLFTSWNGISIELGTDNKLFGKVISSSSEHGKCTYNTAITADSGWVHVVYSFEDKVGGKLYINGSLVTSTASTSSIYWNTTEGNIGYFSTYYNGKINDFRIYDHALSAKEVKELSKGLVLHYPLSQGSTNLYDFESTTSKWITDGGVTLANATDANYGNVVKVTVGSSLTGNHRAYCVVSNIWKVDQVYTVSFLAKANKAVDCTMSRSLANFTSHFTLTTEWKRYIGQINCTETVAGGTLSFQINTTSCDVYFTQVKLELGEIATPYTPGPGDSHYNAMGYNSTTEYDVSGYNNHTTKVGTITYTSDSARYSIATHFINGSYMMGTQNVANYLPKDAITVNLWMKCTTWGTVISCTEGGGWNFEDTGSGLGFQLYVASIGYKGAYTTTRASALCDGKWHMLTGTFSSKDSQTKLYIDTVLQKTTDTGSTNGIGYANNRLIVSGEAQSTTPASSTYTGEISDVRIYATALSAEDVKQLYNTAAALCNNGTLMAYEYVEA